MSTNTITVSLYLVDSVLKEKNSNSKNPNQFDDNVTVQSADRIQWVLGTDSGISSIDSIAQKFKSTIDPQLFSTSPIASNEWTGTVGAPNRPDPYYYTICYTSDTGDYKCIDPKITVSMGEVER